MDYLVVSETWLNSKYKNEEIENKLFNWKIVTNGGRQDYDENNHMGLLLLRNLNCSDNQVKVMKHGSINDDNKCLQYITIEFQNSITGTFMYTNKTPLVNDLKYLAEEIPKSDFLMGDLNLNYMKEADESKLERFCEDMNMKRFLAETTIISPSRQLDHCFLNENFTTRSFSTAFANLYSDHFAITLRIANEDNTLKKSKRTTKTEELTDDIEQLAEDIEQKKTRASANAQKNSKNKSKNEILITDYHGFSITTHDTNTLYDGQWINENIVNMFSVILRNQFTQIYAFTTYFYESVKKGTMDGYNEAKLFTTQVKIFEKDKIMFPINEPNRWIMVIVDCTAKEMIQIELYDPIQESSTNAGLRTKNEFIMTSIVKYLQFEYQEAYGKELPEVNRAILVGELTEDFYYQSGPLILLYAKNKAFNLEHQYENEEINSFRENLLTDFFSKRLSEINSPQKEDNIKHLKRPSTHSGQKKQEHSPAKKQKLKNEKPSKNRDQVHKLPTTQFQEEIQEHSPSKKQKTKNEKPSTNREQVNKPPTSPFQNYLDAHDIRLLNVDADGNCFFSALARYGGCTAAELRHRIVNQMKENPKRYEQLYEPQYVEQYSIICDNVPANNISTRIELMSKDKTWAGFIERFAAAFYFKRNIFELEQYTENSWFWKVFVCETNQDAYDNWHKKDKFFLYFKHPHFQFLSCTDKNLETFPKLDKTSQIYFLYQLSKDQPGMFQEVRGHNLPNDHPYRYNQTTTPANPNR